MNNRNFNYVDLEIRTFEFAKNVRRFVKKLPKSLSNFEDSKQLIKSSGSFGANYIEAIEGLSDKDYLYRIKVCKKETKESRYWLRLIEASDFPDIEKERISLIQESTEIMNIFGSIIRKKEICNVS
jgi:four helix bundle protein